MGVIRLERVTYSYPTALGDQALRNISCSVEEGELLVVTGPADAGKSTLCRVAAGYVPHFFKGELSGVVSVAGVAPSEVSLSEMAMKVGYVFENPFDQLTGASETVFEEVAFGLENMGLARNEIRERCTRSLAQVGISALADRHPRRLSGGQSQRLAIAAVLAMQPRVLILDEPTSQLDPHGAQEVLAVVADMKAAGLTVVVVTQDLQRFVPQADRLLVMDGGRIVQHGPPREVLAEADKRLVRLPTVVDLARHARAAAVLPISSPLPLTVAEAAEALAIDAGTLPSGSNPQAAASTEGADALVVAESLSHEYPGGVRALRELSLSIGQGCLAIVGQNGAGKTSLVKHMNGLLTPSSGRVLVNGLDTREHRVARLARYVSLAFQNPDDQLFRRSIADEVRFGPANLGYPEEKVEALSDRALRRLGLENVSELRPHEVGLSWRKRVAVASCVAMDTPVLVLDEPTGGQDAPGLSVLGALVDELVAQGVAVILVTHDVEFAASHATRVVAMYQGGVLLDGEPGHVFTERALLARTHVEPPALIEVADRLGVRRPIRSVSDLLPTADPGQGPGRSQAGGT